MAVLIIQNDYRPISEHITWMEERRCDIAALLCIIAAWVMPARCQIKVEPKDG